MTFPVRAEGQKRLFFVIYPFSFLNHHLHLTREKGKKKKGQVDYLTVEMQYGGVKLSRTVYLQERVQDGD